MKHFIVLALAFLLVLPALGAMTIDELINSYDYDYYDGTINVTNATDRMIDANNNSINDTLIINLTTDAATAGTYYVIIRLEDAAGLITNYTNVSINATNNRTSVSFSTAQLSKTTYNYTIEIRDQDFGLAYEKHNNPTNTYATYETGAVIHSITDSANIRISITFNVTQNATENVTVHLRYKNSSISATKNATLTTPQTTVGIDIPNETIKSTHHSGTFVVETVQLGSKLFNTNHTTSSYNYQNYAPTSYLINATATSIDTSANNLSDKLQLNVTLNAKVAQSHTITASLYDPSLNFVQTVNTTASVSTGVQIVTLEFNGTKIYRTYESGEFTISVITLNSSSSNDTLTSAATIDLTYADFEPPERPDLTINLTSTYASGETDVALNITNAGDASAYNIVVDIFDENAYENQTVTNSLTPGESTLFTFTIPNTNETTIIAAIVDFNNFIDEDNETNNIDSNAGRSLRVGLEQLYGQGKRVVLEGILLSDGTEALNRTNWTMTLGDGTALNNTLNLTAGESSSVIVEHNYTTKSSFTIVFNATAETLSASATLTLDTIDVIIGQITTVQNNSAGIFLFDIGEEFEPTNVSWGLRTGEDNLTSNSTLLLGANENASIIVEYQYVIPGEYTTNASVNATGQSAYRLTTIFVVEILVHNFQKLASNSTKGVFEFNLNDEYSINKTAKWSFATNDTGGVIVATDNVTLTPDENVTILIEHNFSATGNRSLTARANTSLTSYTANINTTIS